MSFCHSIQFIMNFKFKIKNVGDKADKIFNKKILEILIFNGDVLF